MTTGQKSAKWTWDSVQVGQELPILVRTETQEEINNYLKLNERGRNRQFESKNLHVDEEFAKTGIFAGTVNYGVTTCGFMLECLQQVFPTQALYTAGSSFTMRAIEPIRSMDVIVYSGRVTGKRTEGGKRLVDVDLIGTNQLKQGVATAKATVAM